MSFRRPRSFRVHLVWLLAAAATPLVGGYAVLSGLDAAADYRRARNSSENVAGIVAGQLASMRLEAAATAKRMIDSGRPVADDAARCQADFEAFIVAFPQYAAVALFDRDGTPICGAPPPLISAANRNWFDRARADGEIAALDWKGDQPTLLISRFIPSTQRTLMLTIDARRLSEAVRPMAAGTGTLVSLVDGTWRIAARSTAADRWVGESVTESPMARYAKGRPHGTYVAVGVDGVERLWAFESIPGTDWKAFVGQPVETVFGPARSRLLWRVVFLTMVVLVTVPLTMVLARRLESPIRELADAVDSGRQVFALPSGTPSEIVFLAHSFEKALEDRVSAQRKEAAAGEAMKALSERMIEDQERERSTIARNLHDEVGQALTTIVFDAKAILQSTQPPRETAQRVIETAMRTVDRIREISSELRSPMLDDLGLAATLAWDVETFEQRTGVETRLRCCEPEPSLSPEVATAVYRIIQEALTNVARHSGASRATITIRTERNAAVIEVADDGRGITAEQVSSSRSIGLTSMRERAEMVGGSVEILGKDTGTVVRVSVPLLEEWK